MFLAAADRAGGEDALTALAASKPEVFWPLIAKMLPKTVQASGLDGKELIVTIVRK